VKKIAINYPSEFKKLIIGTKGGKNHIIYEIFNNEVTTLCCLLSLVNILLINNKSGNKKDKIFAKDIKLQSLYSVCKSVIVKNFLSQLILELENSYSSNQYDMKILNDNELLKNYLRRFHYFYSLLSKEIYYDYNSNFVSYKDLNQIAINFLFVVYEF